MDIKFFLGLWL